jgi:osmotically-inducible protein OsmY
MSHNIKDDEHSYQNDDYSRFAAPDFKENEFGAKGTHNHSTGGEIVVLDASRLGEEACSLLMKNPRVDASEIILSVHGSILHVRGIVENQQQKIETELCLKSIPEVSSVINELQIRR